MEQADRGPRARKVTEPGAEVASRPSGSKSEAARHEAGEKRETRGSSRARPAAAAAGRSGRSGAEGRSLDEQVRAALGDRYPFAR